MEIYIVNECCKDQNFVDCAFTTEEMAKEYVNKMNCIEIEKVKSYEDYLSKRANCRGCADCACEDDEPEEPFYVNYTYTRIMLSDTYK